MEPFLVSCQESRKDLSFYEKKKTETRRPLIYKGSRHVADFKYCWPRGVM